MRGSRERTTPWSLFRRLSIEVVAICVVCVLIVAFVKDYFLQTDSELNQQTTYVKNSSEYVLDSLMTRFLA
jgi:hypothetical protein